MWTINKDTVKAVEETCSPREEIETVRGMETAVIETRVAGVTDLGIVREITGKAIAEAETMITENSN